jgi:histidinol dehydrogenase
MQDLPDPKLPAEITAAFDVAYNNIKAFHEAQRGQPLEVETMPGVKCRRVSRPIGGCRFHRPYAVRYDSAAHIGALLQRG